jgi:D-amino-acid dehydrogenase
MQVTIIGGGVIGLCCAYYLQKAGYEVTVIDRGQITEGCSFGNMGYISPSHFIPLASPGIIAQGLKWMLSSSSPFYIKPRLNMDLIKWGWTFRKNATAKKVKENVPPLFELLMLSRRLMNEMKTELNDAFVLIEKGCWMLYQSDKTGDHEKHLARQAEAFGLKTIICNRDDVQAFEPDVEVNAKGGVLYLDDCHTNPASFMKTLYRHLEKKGVKFMLGTEVKGFEKNNAQIAAVITSRGKTDCELLILANGSWMPQVAKHLGIQLLMQPGKGYSIVYNQLEKNLHYPSILVDDRTATSPIDRWLRIGGTMELSGHDDNILPKRVMAIYRAVKKYYPSLSISEPEIKNAWFGYRPVTPDGLPYIGPHPRYRNLIFAGGHAMLGLSAAAGTGKLVEEIAGKKKLTMDIAAFRPDRFR